VIHVEIGFKGYRNPRNLNTGEIKEKLSTLRNMRVNAIRG